MIRHSEEAAVSDVLVTQVEAYCDAALEAGERVNLNDIFGRFPDVRASDLALDAALEYVLRGEARTADELGRAGSRLEGEFPDLELQIRDAVAMTEIFFDRDDASDLLLERPAVGLPFDIGPMLSSGIRKYRLVEHVGRGASGDVYRALDRAFDNGAQTREVAVKLIARPIVSAQEEAELDAEAMKASRVRHPQVVRVLDRGRTDDEFEYVVFEFIDGSDLAVHLDERGTPRPTAAEAAKLVIEMCRATHAVHQAGLVHGDIKPQNILVDTVDGVAMPKLADFSSASHLDASDRLMSSVTGPGWEGSLAFMAPEGVGGAPASQASDVYALATLALWLIGADLREPDPESVINDEMLRAIIVRARAADPDARQPSAMHLADDLKDWLSNRVPGWYHPAAPLRAKLWVRRSPMRAAASALLMVSLGAGLAFLVSTSRLLDLSSFVRAERQSKEDILLKPDEISPDGRMPFELWIGFHEFSRLFGGGSDAAPITGAGDERLAIRDALTADLRSQPEGFKRFVLVNFMIMLSLSIDKTMFPATHSYIEEAQEYAGTHLSPSDPWHDTLAYLSAVSMIKRTVSNDPRLERMPQDAHDRAVHHACQTLAEYLVPRFPATLSDGAFLARTIEPMHRLALEYASHAVRLDADAPAALEAVVRRHGALTSVALDR